MILFASSTAVIHYDKSAGSVILTWEDTASEDGLRDALDRLEGCLHEQGIGKCLADLRLLNILTQAEQDWIIQDWLERATAAGLRRVAIVLPEDSQAEYSLERLLTAVAGISIEIQRFMDFFTAYSWLRNER